MEENKIIFKKDRKDNDYFSLVIAFITVLLLVFQVMANNHISKAGRDFINAERAKRMAVKGKAHKARIEKALEKERLLRQKEEDELLSVAGEHNRVKEETKIGKISKGMDYRQKLDIYRHSNQAK